MTVTVLPSLPLSRVTRLRPEATWQFLPPDRPTVNVVRDSSRDDAMRRCITVRSLSLLTGDHLYVLVESERPPLGISFDVYVRAKGEERKAGSIARAASGPGFKFRHSLQFGWFRFDADRADVILRPNPQAAEETLHLLEMWDGGEIVFRDVPVRRP